MGATSTKYNWYITDAGGALKSVHERTDSGSVSLTNQAIYGGGRLGMYDVTTGILNYEITDHLGNVRLTIRDSSTVGDNSVEVLSWADYYPFGEVLPGRNSNPTGMFGYQGQERVSNSTNEVSGSRWYNFNLRMYNPSLGRFNTIDPYSQFNSPYLAMANNPISFVDPDGGRSVENDQTKAAREKARREFKEWWADNAKYFRHRGGDANGGNLVYHLNNLAVFGTSDFERMDLNKRGIDGSIWSQAGWASVIKEVFGIRESDASDQAYGAAVCEAAMREAEAELAQWAFNNQIERLMHGFKHEEYEREAQQQKREDRKKARKEKRKVRKQDAKDGIEPPTPEGDLYASVKSLNLFDIEKIHKGIYYTQDIDPKTGEPYVGFYPDIKNNGSITYISVNATNFQGDDGNPVGVSLNVANSKEERPHSGTGVTTIGRDVNAYGREESRNLFTPENLYKLDPNRIYYRYMYGTPNNFEWRYGSFPQ